MTEQAPFDRHRDIVRPEWIDYNGHMNVAYYFLVFDRATDTFYDHLGIGAEYKNRMDFSTFTLEGHITYDREVLEGDKLRIRTFLLGFDRKRLHYFHEMYHAEQGYLAATNELMAVHVDMKERRSAPFDDATMATLERVLALHATVPVPEKAGRRIGLQNRKPG